MTTMTYHLPRTVTDANGKSDPIHGRPTSLPIPIALRRRVGPIVSLAAAAVLLLALAGGLVAIRFGAPGSDDGRFASIPAALVSPEATPAGPVEFLWETRGDPADPLGNPAHVAIAPDGAIWVTDGDNNRFQIFAPDGSLLEVWGTAGSGDGEFDFDIGWGGYYQGAIAFSPDGSFYVADPGNHRIQKFGPDRSFLLAWGSKGFEPGQFIAPIDLVVDGQGRVYVADTDHNYPSGGGSGGVQVFDADGRFLAEWGAYGTDPGEMFDPYGIGVDPADGTILVAEHGSSRVQRFTPEGEFLHGWGGYGAKEGLFVFALDVAVDAGGRVYVTDYSNHRVQVFDRGGAFLAAWGGHGRDPGEFTYPLGVAVGDDGTVYVTEEISWPYGSCCRLQAFRIGDVPPPLPAATPAP